MGTEIMENRADETAATYRSQEALPPHWYYDEAVYQAESKAIFGNSWLCAGHKSEFVNPGDFARVDFCDETILVVRGKDDVLRAFYNVCQHRGHILVDERRGNLKGRIICPYHAWTYGLDGHLRRAPLSESMEGFPKDKLGLPAVRVEQYANFVWVNTDSNAPSMAETHPGMDKAFARLLPDVAEAQFFEGANTELQVNWKTQTDNALDTYHFSLAGPEHKKLVGSFDIKNFHREFHGNWLIEWGLPPENVTNTGYPIDPSQARGEEDGFTLAWVFPDLWIVTLPVARTFFTYRTTPFGAEKTVLDYAYYGPKEVFQQDRTRQAIDWMNGPLSIEDNSYCTAVHKGQKSKGFKGAHFMVNPNEPEFDEHPGVSVHKMIRDKVEPLLNSSK